MARRARGDGRVPLPPARSRRWTRGSTRRLEALSRPGRGRRRKRGQPRRGHARLARRRALHPGRRCRDGRVSRGDCRGRFGGPARTLERPVRRALTVQRHRRRRCRRSRTATRRWRGFLTAAAADRRRSRSSSPRCSATRSPAAALRPVEAMRRRGGGDLRRRAGPAPAAAALRATRSAGSARR